MADVRATESEGAGALPLLWARVDDRLIHGQVTVAWRRHLGYRAIWVVDDAAAREAFLRAALCLAAPPDVPVQVLTVDHALELLRRGEGGAGLLLLLRRPQAAQALVAGGAPLRQVNVGNLAPAAGARRVVRSIALNAADVAALDALAAQGVRITFQPTPDDRALSWAGVRRRWAGG